MQSALNYQDIYYHDIYYYDIYFRAGLLTRLLVPKRDRDYSRHNPRRDRDLCISGRDETFVLLPQALHGTMQDACTAMPYNTPPPMSFPTQCQCEFKRAACAGHFIVHTCIVLLHHYYAGLLWCFCIFSIFCKIFRAYMY